MWTLELQTEQTELIQAFIESTPESAIPAQCSLHFLHQDAKLLLVLSGDAVVYRYGDRAFVMVRKDLKIVPIFERRFLYPDFCGEVDREPIPKAELGSCLDKAEYFSRTDDGRTTLLCGADHADPVHL